jgi:hypothetical protein
MRGYAIFLEIAPVLSAGRMIRLRCSEHVGGIRTHDDATGIQM